MQFSWMRNSGDTRQGTGQRILGFLGIAAFLGFSLLAIIYGANLLDKPMQTEVRIGAGPKNSEARELIEAIAETAARHAPGLRITLVDTAGSQDNIRLLEQGKIDLATVQSDAITRPNLRLVATLYRDLYQLLVRTDSNIKSVSDLTKHRIALSNVTSGQYRSFWFLIGHYGVPPESLHAIPMSPKDAEDAIRKGTVDALFRVRAARNRPIQWLIESANLRLIPIDQAAAMKLRRPALSAAIIPKGTYSGHPPIPAKDLPTVAAQRLLLAREEVPASIVRQLTEILFVRRRDMTVLTPLAGSISRPDQNTGTLLPLHVGAQAFYDREKPSIFEEKAEYFAFLISLALVLGSLFLWIKRRWDDSQKGRIDDYNLDLIKICDQARASTDPVRIAACKDKMVTMLAKVVNDLDYNRVDAKGFHYFAFTWEAVNSAIANHEQTLSNGHKRTLRPAKSKAKRPVKSK